MRYVRIKRFAEMSGYTPRAIYCKMSEGVWVEGREYRKAPDNQVLIDLEGYERWVEGGQAQGSNPSRRASASGSRGTDAAA